jgi:hypothetical protein
MHAQTFIVGQNNFIVLMVVMAKVGLKPQNRISYFYTDTST